MSRAAVLPPSGAGAAAVRGPARDGGRSAGEPAAGARALESVLLAAVERADLLPAHASIALEVAALAPPGADRRALALLVLLVLDAARRGSTYLPIAGKPALEALRARALALGLDAGDARALERAAGRLAGGGDAPGQLALGLGAGAAPSPLAPLCGAPGERTPLVVSGAGLALARLEAEERQLGALLSQRRGVLATDADADAALARVASAHLDAAGAVLDPTQREAVRAALGRPLTLITGGPGTGKTSIVVAILRALVRLCPPPVAPAGIALAAPTGKAADRMRAAIDAALARALAAPGAEAERALDARLRAELPEPRTLHRLLGYHAGSDRFRHHEENPLAERLVVVDEASMLDVGLLRRLVLALRDDAALVLLGDRDQLPSVDAGAVLADLVRAAEAGARAVCVATLGTSHRMRADDPAGAHVLGVAQALRDGRAPPLADAALVPGALARAADPHVLPAGASLFSLDEGAALARFAEAWLEAELARRGAEVERVFRLDGDRLALVAGDEAAVRALLVRTSEARLLAVTRGPGLRTGAERLSAHLGARYRRRLGLGRGDRIAPLEPLVALRNDYERGLFNGDTGLAIAAAAPGAGPRMLFVTEKRGGLALFLLDDVAHLVERAWALTVHRAQGSEHDAVALVLPDADVPGLLTRELVYTALTRARRAATIVGSHAVLALAAARATERTTALRVT